MTENSQTSKEINNLIEFLIEDLKETGELLRETDRKLSFLIQIYTGAFVLIATLSVNKIIDLNALLGISGLALIIIFIFFTRWLFEFSLKSKETKAIYIHRMNFLRREMHYFLQTKHYDLIGYWTSPELSALQSKTLTSLPPVKEANKPKRVGLDDLYPIALRWILLLLGFVLVFIFSNIIKASVTLVFIRGSQFIPWLVIVILVPTIIWLYTDFLGKENDKSIDKQIKSYKNSSIKREQENKLKEESQKTTDIVSQPKPSRRIKKQASYND